MSRILKDKDNLITLAYGNGHQGVDVIPSDHGLCDVLAHSSGKVIEARNNYAGENEQTGNSYGNFIKVQCSNGMSYLYAHLKKGTVTKKVGDNVNQGEVLGSMWKSGRANGIHVHMEIFNAANQKIDPTKYLVDDIVVPVVTEPYAGVSTEELAHRVIAGDFGNGDERKNKLGIRYNEVQDSVNKILAHTPTVDTSISLRKGDRVVITKAGNGSSNGNAGTSYGIGYERTILNIFTGRAYPYQVGNSSGVTGYYTADGLRRL